MANLSDMSKIKIALFSTASTLAAFLTYVTSSNNIANRSDVSIEAEVAVCMLMFALSFSLLSWCCLTILSSRQHLAAVNLSGTSIGDLSLVFAAAAGIATLETVIGLGPFSNSRLQMAGGGWTFLVVVFVTYAAALCKGWKQIRSPPVAPTNSTGEDDSIAGLIVIFPNLAT